MSQVREGWDPANLFNPTTFCMFVSVPNQEPVIQCLSFVDVLHVCFSYINYVIFSVELFYIRHFVPFYIWLIDMGFAHCLRPYADQ